ncbi:hypothetical protein BJ322DRAFT_1089812 [Thelephora terrestris]|uniref:Uncharacterized protein n=1 Tax=Thelephora terrestris TaxID=56493 RepID=A0A9P6H4Z1_9AGAM|nr:hypothetical protein BJ322DRAFT_1089812 [Thelephora terrestris]
MSNISFAFAFIAGTFLECVMYGIFVPLLIAACYVQWEKHSKGRRVHRVMVFTAVFFGLTITTHCVLSVYRSMRAILHSTQGEPVDQYLNPPYPALEIFRLGLFQLQIIVGDIIMMHRMYHVYNKNLLLCVVPSVTITALFAVGCCTVNQFRDLTTPRSIKLLQDFSAACFCLTLFNSLFMTFAISFKLWFVHRETTRANIRIKGSVVLRAMKVLIESAALWTACVALSFFAFLAQTNLMYTFLAISGPAAGISFCLIIVRLGMTLQNRESREESWDVSIHTPSTQTPSTGHISLSFSRDAIKRDLDSKELKLDPESSRRGCGDGDQSGNFAKAALS